MMQVKQSHTLKNLAHDHLQKPEATHLLLGISKRGDTYLRTLLIHGTRAVIRFSEKKAGPESWLLQLIIRRNKNVADVALANKNARIIWALLAKGTIFHPNHTSAAPAAAVAVAA